MIPRLKKIQKAINIPLKKEEFLEQYNKSSPLSLRASTSLLSRFRIERASLFRDDNWSIEKYRKPFIMWLTALAFEKEKK